jgi:hypothetical protein
MPNVQLRSVEFGRLRSGVTGSLGVKYTLLDVGGTTIFGPTATGVYELASGSGCYAADVSFPDSFHGSVLWACPPVTSSFNGFILSQSFATEQYNVESNDPKVADTWAMVNSITGSVAGLIDVAFGRWKIDKVANQMVFFREDNVTVVATFNLFDDTGAPAFDGVFERRLVPPVTP